MNYISTASHLIGTKSQSSQPVNIIELQSQLQHKKQNYNYNY